MLPVIRSSRSDWDLIAIWRYIARDNPAAATRMLERIEDRIEALGKNPLMGEAQPQFGDRTRRIIVGNYLVFYDVLADAVHVLRIFHAARNLSDLFDEP
jgi:toxin ParE1/3/4